MGTQTKCVVWKDKVCFKTLFYHTSQQISCWYSGPDNRRNDSSSVNRLADAFVIILYHFHSMQTIWSALDLIFTSVQQTQISDCGIQTIAAGSLKLAGAITLHHNSFFLTFAGNRWLYQAGTTWSASSVTLSHKARQWLALLASHSVALRLWSNMETLFICHWQFFDIWKQYEDWTSSGDISLKCKRKESLFSIMISLSRWFYTLSHFNIFINVWRKCKDAFPHFIFEHNRLLFRITELKRLLEKITFEDDLWA